jgi:hypothetical protein
MHLHNVFIYLHFIYKSSARVMFVYMFNCMHFKKTLCGIAQLDVGYVTICSAERRKSSFMYCDPTWVVGDATIWY